MAGTTRAVRPTTNLDVPIAVETRAGWRTTEFWLVVLAVLAGIVQQAVGVFNITDQRVLLVQGILLAAYGLSRGFAKSGVPNVAPVQPVITTTSSAPTSEHAV